MKYILLIYQNPATWETFSEAERNRVIVDESWRSSRSPWSGSAADWPSIERKTVRGDGVLAATDGLLVESRSSSPATIVECETRNGRPRSRTLADAVLAMEVRLITEPAARRCEHGAGRRGPAPRPRARSRPRRRYGI